MFHNSSSIKVIISFGFMAGAYASATQIRPNSDRVYILQLDYHAGLYAIVMGHETPQDEMEIKDFLMESDIIKKLKTYQDSLQYVGLYLDAYKVIDSSDPSSSAQLQTVDGFRYEFRKLGQTGSEFESVVPSDQFDAVVKGKANGFAKFDYSTDARDWQVGDVADTLFTIAHPEHAEVLFQVLKPAASEEEDVVIHGHHSGIDAGKYAINLNDS